MDFALDSEQKLLRKEIIRFARAELNGSTEERDRAHAFSRELWDKIGNLGLHGLPIDPEWGGSGLNAVSTAVALEALGYGCEDGGLAFSVYAHLLTCAIPVWKFGTDEQKERWLRGLCSGELIGGNAMTEPDSGSDAFTMRTVAVPDGDGFRINGTKTFASNAPVADVMLLYAANDPEKGFHGGVTAFLLDTKTEGVHIPKGIDKMGLRTSPMGEIVLEDAYLPASSVLSGVGSGGVLFTDSMVWERSCLFAGHVGTMERLLDVAIEQANNRKQFGQPIGKFQSNSHKIADMKIRLEAARLLTYKAAWSIDRRRGAPLNAAICKTFVSDAFLKTALDTLQIHGGYGYMTETGIERIVRDAVGSPIYSGTNEVQRNIIARWLGL